MITATTALDRAPYADVDVGHNRVALLKDGYQTFPAMLQAAREARSTLCIETYILRDDAVGNQLASVLIERAYAGVEVNLMYDGWGAQVSDAYVMRLKLAGVRVLCFAPVRLLSRVARVIGRLRRRNHRKAMIVDGRVAFTGGLNLSNDYAAVEDGGHGWRDTHVRIEGPAAVQLERMFLDTWRKHRGPRLDEARYRRRTPHDDDDRVRFIGNEFAADRKDIRVAYVKAFNAARRRIHVMNAYFMPPSRVLRSLMKAARRGVDVTLILAGTTDVPIVLLGSRGLYGKLLRSGVRIFEWKGRILHAKTAVVDAHWSTIGSANLDTLSLRQNLEVNAVIEDDTFGASMEKLFNTDLHSCVEVTRETLADRSLFERLLSWLAYQVRSWL
ncbi:MAG: cardiolipin synthase ClsB [Myxococcaceae bacterium]|nr:cardiolipin synthase ClsB [Myxococcaceae bacterium]